MLESFKVLFSASILLAISLSACHIVKRKAPDGQLYVFSSREGCESVKSELPCTLTWQLNPYIAKVYNQSNDIVASTTQLYRSRSINNNCILAVENILCSQAVPKCSLEDGSRDYGNISKLCEDIYNKCPQSIVNNLKQKNFCQSLKTGKHPNSTCVAPSSPVTGACPQPKYKMPSEFLADYRKKSAGLVQSFDNLQNLRYGNGERVFSSECIILLEEISCSPLYCSVDETKLLLKHDRDDCYKIIKECYEDALSKLAETSTLTSYIKSVRANLQAQCDTYPTAATAQLQAEPPLLHHTMPTTQQLKHTTINHLPSTIHHQPPTINHTPSTTHHQPLITNHVASTTHHQPLTTNHPPSTTPRQCNIPDKQDELEKPVNCISNSAASFQFGYPMVLVAVIASFIVKFYAV